MNASACSVDHCNPDSFDEKGDIKNGALTLFTYKAEKRDQIAVVR
jgi:branched-chain amino acid transport system substrate-binding protein